MKQSSRQRFQSARGFLLTAGDVAVKSRNANIFFTGALLRFDESGSLFHANDEATGYFRIERSRMSRLFHSQNSLNPRDDFVGGGIGRFVQVDESRANVVLNGTFERRAAVRKRRVMIRSDVEFVKVFE